MGSTSDWTVMQHAVAVLKEFDVPHEAQVVSAHRTPDSMFQYAAKARGRDELLRIMAMFEKQYGERFKADAGWQTVI